MKRIYLAFILIGVANAMLGPLIPAFESRWHIDDAQAGLLFVAEFLSAVALASVTPWLGRRIGFRHAVAAGVVGIAAGAAGCMSNSWPVTVASIGLCGAGLGISITAANLAIAVAAKGPSARPLLWLNMCWSIGAVAAPWLIAALGGAFLPAMAAAFLVLSLVVVIGGVNPRFTPAHHGKAAGIPHLKFAMMLFLYVGVEIAISGWISTYATRGAVERLWAVLPSVFWFAILTGRALSPAILHRMPPRILVPAGLALGFGGGAVLLGGSGAAAMLLGTVVTGFGFAPIYPVLIGEYTDRAGDAASGLVFSAAGLGGAVIPPLVGAVSTATHSLRLGLAGAVLCIPIVFALHSRTPDPERRA